MAASYSDLVEEVLAALHGYTSSVEELTTLTAGLSATGLVLQYDPVQTLDRGYVEVEDELIYLQSAVNGSAVIPPWGRGQQGSAAAVHPAGVRVTAHPQFPRQRVGVAINETIRSLDTELYAVNSFLFSPNPAQTTYALPVNATGVLSCSQDTFGPSREWEPVVRWRVDLDADTAVFNSPVTVTFPTGLRPGKQAKIVYTSALVEIAPGGMLVDSGLSEQARDIVVLGAQMRLLASQDYPRLQNTTVEQSQRDMIVPIMSAARIVSQLKLMYDDRVDREKQRLLRLYPGGVTITR